MYGTPNQYFADFQLSGHLRFPALSGKPYFDQTTSHFRSTLLSLKLRSYSDGQESNTIPIRQE